MLESLFRLWDKVGVKMGRKRQASSGLALQGRYVVEHWRAGKLIGVYPVKNDITNEGKNLIFEVMFHNGTQVASSSWYIGLINITGFSTLAAGDTMASHVGWTEFTSYSQSNRVAWGPDAAATQQISNSTPAVFDMTTTGTIKGLFITSNNSKGGTSGKLWATALFNADVPVVNGDELKATYTVNA
jgi:hypothetical protein